MNKNEVIGGLRTLAQRLSEMDLGNMYLSTPHISIHCETVEEFLDKVKQTPEGVLDKGESYIWWRSNYQGAELSFTLEMKTAAHMKLDPRIKALEGK